MTIIVSDVGGTNIRFARTTGYASPLTHIANMKCADFQTIEDAFSAYLKTQDTLEAVAIAVAGPVNDDRINITNNDWQFSKTVLQKTLNAKRFLVLNDFTAQALAQIDPSQNEVILSGKSDDTAPLLVIGPGTGLGVSALIPSPSGHIPLEGEGGHVCFSPRSDKEIALLKFRQQTHDHITAEHFVSGAGLENIYRFLADAADIKPTLTTPEIGAEAIKNPGICQDAAIMLLEILATTIVNNVLTLGAWRGVVIAGGVIPQLAPLIPKSNFTNRIHTIGIASHLTQNLPIWLSTNPHAGLHGALAGLNSAHLQSRSAIQSK